MHEKHILAMLCCTLLLPWPIEAGVLFSEDFSYPDGPLVTVANGEWKTHSGTAGQALVSSGELKLSQSQSEDVSAPFPDGIQGPEQAAALYAAFKVTFSALPTGAKGGYFAHFKDGAATTGLRCRIFATTNGAAPGSFQLGIAAAASEASSMVAQNLKPGVSYKLVCRMALADNVCTLWINPTSEDRPSATSTDEATVKAVTAFAFRQSRSSGSGMGEVTVDNLKVATSFTETMLASAPVILSEPADCMAVQGGDAVFQVVATGAEPLWYQWFFNESELSGATTSALELAGVGPADAGVYQVIVSNAAGSTASAAVRLAVQPAELIIGISLDQAAGVRLDWPADPDQTYSIWAGDSFEADFSLLTAGLIFPEGAGLFRETHSEATRFYWICSP